MLLSEFTVEDAVKLARTEGWTEGREEGIAQGIMQGMERGIMQGIERGIMQGMERGIVQGVERGKAQGVFETAAAFKKMGVSAEQITLATGLTPEQLADL